MGLSLPVSPKILIVMMSAVGDAVHVLPVVSALKRHDPGTRITWILQPVPASLVRGHPDVDEIVPFDRGRGWRAFLDVRRALRGRDFDLVLDLQVYTKASIVTRLVPGRVKLGFDRARALDGNWLVTNHRIPPHEPQHVQDQYFEFLRYLGVEPEPVEWQLGPWPAERAWQAEFFRGFDRPVVALVLATSDQSKNWTAEGWADLHDALARQGLQPVMVGGRSVLEVATEAQVRERVRTPVVSALGCSLRELVSILDGCALVVSPDTGPLHMAVALGRPVITLAGTMNPKRTGPYRRFHDLIVDAYGREGEEYGVTRERRPGGMRRITADDVLEKVELWRSKYAR
jgi:heptosyltransferase I